MEICYTYLVGGILVTAMSSGIAGGSCLRFLAGGNGNEGVVEIALLVNGFTALRSCRVTFTDKSE
jgi:hypothetical protein